MTFCVSAILPVLASREPKRPKSRSVCRLLGTRPATTQIQIHDTRVEGVHVVDETGAHVLAAVRGAMYESLDYGDSWTMINGSSAFGTCNSA